MLGPERINEHMPCKTRALEGAIGREVRALRHHHQLTVAEVSGMTGLSVGMLSKIENGHTSASLTTLQSLALALGVPLTAFFRGFETTRPAVLTRSGDSVERSCDRNPTRHPLGRIGTSTSGVTMVPRLVTLAAPYELRAEAPMRGLATLHMLAGRLDYRHGTALFPLAPGDTLLFDTDVEHGPARLVAGPVRYLCVASTTQDAAR